MPGLDGLETMRLIFRQRPTIPIVTSHRPLTLEPDLPAMAAKGGATISPPKPFMPADPLPAAEGRIAGTDAGFADTGARP
jgi:hypothetical protein